MLGLHCAVNEDNLNIIKGKFGAIQTMPGGRLSYKCPDIQKELALADKYGIELVFHAPLCCYVVSTKQGVIKPTKSYIHQLDDQVGIYNRVNGLNRMYKLVIHTGSLPKEANHQKEACDFVSWFLSNIKNLILCIENDVGSRGGTACGNLSFIASICLTYKSPRVKMCIDTNHAWGHEPEGIDITNMEDWDKLKDFIGVIHYNCIPSICPRYGHVDRHSTYLIEDSGDNVKWLLELWDKRYDVPYILERNDISYSLKDYEFLNRKGEHNDL